MASCFTCNYLKKVKIKNKTSYFCRGGRKMSKIEYLYTPLWCPKNKILDEHSRKLQRV